MAQTADQITHDIRNTRENLSSNFQELESKVKSATDWRHHFQNHSGAMMAAAFGVGALVSILSSGRSSRASSAAGVGSSGAQRDSRSGAGNEVLAKWNSMKSALVGVAAARLTGYLDQVVPGFHDELKKGETGRPEGFNSH